MPRAYRSDLRDEQTKQTRERILHALADQLGDAREDFSIPKVAERAGVSVRTVYHHFPNREAQIEAVARWLDARIAASEPGPERLEDVPAMAERVIRRAAANMNEVRAQLAPGVARVVRERRRRTRDRAVARAVQASCAPAAAAQVAAALVALVGGELGVALEDRGGLRGDALVETHVWIVRVVVDAARRGDLPRHAPSKTERA